MGRGNVFQKTIVHHLNLGFGVERDEGDTRYSCLNAAHACIAATFEGRGVVRVRTLTTFGRFLGLLESA